MVVPLLRVVPRLNLLQLLLGVVSYCLLLLLLLVFRALPPVYLEPVHLRDVLVLHRLGYQLRVDLP